MRAVVTRVASASVTVEGVVVGRIESTGLLALVGVTHTDTVAGAHALAAKLAHLRILDGECSCAQVHAPILVVSQFTLYGDASHGRRPSWAAAAPRAVAKPLIDAMIAELRRLGVRVSTGTFGAHMSVTSINDGPVTVIVDVA